MNLDELDKQATRLAVENVRKNLEKLSMGQEISILSFASKELYPKLEGKGYGLWVPPRDPEIFKVASNKNLATLLLSPTRPKPILMLLDVFPDKATFQYRHGLAEELGVAYGRFIELIADGTIILTLSQLPSYFKPEFYEEIFYACEKQGYFPSTVGLAISSFMGILKLCDLALKDNVPFEQGWQELVFRKHQEYDHRENRNRIIKTMSNSTLDKIFRESLLFDRDAVIDLAATALTDLNFFGFEHLSVIAEKVMKKNDYYGFGVLTGYQDYLIYPCNVGLFGLLTYDLDDVQLMKYLRVADDRITTLWEDILLSSKASSSLVTDPFEANIVSNPDPKQLERFVGRPDLELDKNIVEFKNAVNRYEFSEMQKSYKKLVEIISERYNRELGDWFKREKIVKSTVYLGIGLTTLAGATKGWGYLNWLLKEYPHIGQAVSPAILKIIEKIRKKDMSRFLVEKWPFAEKGLPLALWKYGISPKDIKREKTS